MKNKYSVQYYNVNGPTTQKIVYAHSIGGAKIIATKAASGSATGITVNGPEGMFVRNVSDSYWGFCRGAKPWEEV